MLRRLLSLIIGRRRGPVPSYYQLSAKVHGIISDLAQQEQRSKEEIHTSLLTKALAQHQSTHDLWNRWHSLSQREQQVTALTCLGYTNNQIAAKLGVSPTTIKTHVRNIFIRYQLHSKVELRIALQDWDFREWD